MQVSSMIIELDGLSTGYQNLEFIFKFRGQSNRVLN